SASTLVVGTRVWVPRLRAELEIIEGATRGRVRVASGAVKLWVGIDELRVLGAKGEPTARAESASKSEGGKPGARDEKLEGGAPAAEPVAIRTSANTLDLRGLRVDEAIGLTESFLDRLYGSGEKIGFLLHGVGTGALRDAVREYLRDATRAAAQSYVETWRPGSSDEGGDRLTVVQMA
nr:Smr/MutS family protein [Myxococcota bacterium]